MVLLATGSDLWIRPSASTSVPPSPRAQNQDPNGACKQHYFWRFTLTIRSHTDHLAAPNQTQPPVPKSSHPATLPNDTSDPSANEKKSSREPTSHFATELATDTVEECPDVSSSLKSVAGGLSAIVKHYNVRPYLLCSLARDTHSYPSKRWHGVKPQIYWCSKLKS